MVGAPGSAAGGRDKLVEQVNARLLAECRKNQCAFKTDSDVLTPGCDQKLDSLARALLQTKKKLGAGGVTDFKFEVTGYTHASGKPEFDRELSARRAATIAREMVARGVSPNQILAFGTGGNRPPAPPDTAKIPRYEVQVRQAR